MKRLVFVLLLSLCVAYSGIAAEPECGVRCNGGWASGTLIKGAPPGQSWVVTNKHVVAAGGAKQVKNDGKVYTSRPLIISEDADVAILEIDQVIEGAIALAPEDPTRKTRIRVRGYGVNSGGFDTPRRGFLDRIRGDRVTTPIFISPGDSGSGLIDEDTNELTGVIWGCQGQGGGPGVGLPVSKVKALLMKLPPRKLTYNF